MIAVLIASDQMSSRGLGGRLKNFGYRVRVTHMLHPTPIVDCYDCTVRTYDTIRYRFVLRSDFC